MEASLASCTDFFPRQRTVQAARAASSSDASEETRLTLCPREIIRVGEGAAAAGLSHRLAWVPWAGGSARHPPCSHPLAGGRPL